MENIFGKMIIVKCEIYFIITKNQDIVHFLHRKKCLKDTILHNTIILQNKNIQLLLLMYSFVLIIIIGMFFNDSLFVSCT